MTLRLLGLSLLLAVVAPLPAWAQAVGSVLSIASPLDQSAIYQPTAVALDSQGRVMIVYKARNAEDDIVPYSALKTGETWTCDAIPMPELGRFASTLHLRGLAAGPAGDFHLVATHYGVVYYWRWANGAWSAPEALCETVGGLSTCGVTVDPQGEPLVVYTTTRFRCLQKRAGEWVTARLPFEIAQRPITPVMTDANGAIHLLASSRGVPVTASLASDGDPLVEGAWTGTPTTPRAEWTTPLPTSGAGLELALDWPRQRVVAAWSERNSVKVASAPIGATTEGAWRVETIDEPAGAGSRHHRLVSNATGAVGLLLYANVKGEMHLLFRWVGPDGLGQAIPLLRPGTDTEAAAFRSIGSEDLNLAIDPQGVAHVAVLAEKRGEVPAGTKRLFYATVTGGGVAGSGPEVEGHGTTEMEREGAPPDFAVKILAPDAALAEQGRNAYNFSRHQSIQPRIEVTNQGAEYYGDLDLEVVIDGATVRVRYLDKSGHMKPLLERDQKHTFYLPSIQYIADDASGTAPPPLTYNEGSRPNKTVRLSTGLGRKTCIATVDPDGVIEEESEDNNTAEVEYIVSDGRNQNDRERLAANDTILGLNDLSVLRPPTLRSNTQLIRAGYVQRPTQLDVLVGNPRLAGVFPSVDVEAYLDDTLLTREQIGPLGKTPNLVEKLLGTCVFYEPTPPKPDVSGALLQIPVDLTSVAVGNHRLRVVVDPLDRYADRVRDNNEATLDFGVRPPGGDLRVRVIDKTGDRGPVSHACVTLQDLWAGWTDANGWVTIPDVPPGNYDASALGAERLHEDPPFYHGSAQPFSVSGNQETSVTIELEKPLTIVGDVRVAGTNALLTDARVEALVADDDLYVGGSADGGHYRIPNVPPGQHRVVVGAYGYQTAEVTVNATRQGQTDEFRADVTLTDGPRASITGRVVDQSGKGVSGAMVWLTGTPCGALTDAQGNYTVGRIAAGRAYTVNATETDYTLASANLAPLAGGETRSIEPLTIRKINREFKTIDFDATTYALCESTAPAGEMAPIQVDASFGKFSGAIGLSYHRAAGQDQAEIDDVFVWLEGGTFIEGGVSSTISPADLIGVNLDTLAVGPMGTLLNGYGYVFKGISGINKLAEWYYGEQDPSMLNRSNQVTATYISHTGTEQEQEPLIDVPTSLDIPVAMTFAGGGTTVVRVDFIEIRDASNPSKTIRAEWYSPGFCVFHVGKGFDLSSLEVELRIAVLNERLQSGVLGNTSRNRILWKPNETRWLRVEGYNYDVWGE